MGANLEEIGKKALATGAVVGGASVALSVGMEVIDPAFEKIASTWSVKFQSEGIEKAAEGETGATLAQTELGKNVSTLKDKILEKGQDSAMEAALEPETAASQMTMAPVVDAHADDHETVQTADKGADVYPTGNNGLPLPGKGLIDSTVDPNKIKYREDDSSIST